MCSVGKVISLPSTREALAVFFFVFFDNVCFREPYFFSHDLVLIALAILMNRRLITLH